jgi:hypothetical protein
MSSKLIWVPHGLLRTFSGNLSSCDLVNSNIEVCTDERFAELQFIINDFTKVKGWKMMDYGDEVHRRAENMRPHMKHMPKVALVNPDGSVLDMLQNCCDFMKKETAERFVFPSIKDAYYSCRLSA